MRFLVDVKTSLASDISILISKLLYKMSEILKLKPEAIWKYFHEITQIPRPSKKEERIIQYLLDFAKEHGFEAKKDEVGNVVIKKAATPGMENKKAVILQSHTDMVCEKNNDTEHDFDNDPITTWIDGDWVKAKGTTLGGDDGIGIAASLAILTDNTIKHGPIECFSLLMKKPE
jgi:dipeptidase D